MEIQTKPWGSYTNLLDEEYTKVKKIVVKSGESPSYQYHFKRSEVWIIVKGNAQVKNDELVFIEVQLGSYFGEDDIVRLEDKYGRV